MPIEIIAKRNGFRRAGVAHEGTRVWPDGALTPEQLQQLRDEPMLVVRDIDTVSPVAGQSTGGPADTEPKDQAGKPRR